MLAHLNPNLCTYKVQTASQTNLTGTHAVDTILEVLAFQTRESDPSTSTTLLIQPPSLYLQYNLNQWQDMGPIKVYGMSTFNAQRVTLALLEFGIEDFELIKVDFGAKEHFSPEFLSIQPFHQIPVFESGDFHLYESRAIVRYIAEKYKDQGPDIVGKTLEEQALVNQWVDSEAHQFNDFAFTPWSREFYLSYTLKRPLNKPLLSPLYEKLGYFLDVAEKQLAKTKYLAGDFYSMADLNIAPSLLRVNVLHSELIDERKNVKAWYDVITSRPAFKKMLEADEGWKFPYGPFTSEEAQKLRS